MSDITKRQKELLEHIINSIRDNSMPPTISQMAKSMGVRSKNAIVKLLKELQDKGYIKRDSSARGIKVLQSLGRSLQKGISLVPVLGDVPAGGPMLTDEHIEEWVSLPNILTEGKKGVFLLRVYGDSMINAGIFNNDLVVVCPTKEVKNNDIVVGLIGQEVTVKRLVKSAGKTYLKAENPKYKDIYPEGEWSVQGRVIGVIRQLN